MTLLAITENHNIDTYRDENYLSQLAMYESKSRTAPCETRHPKTVLKTE